MGVSKMSKKALSREWQIKRMNREEKMRLVRRYESFEAME
jgi:predicted GIY-YIG superfamily endonuclease